MAGKRLEFETARATEESFLAAEKGKKFLGKFRTLSREVKEEPSEEKGTGLTRDVVIVGCTSARDLSACWHTVTKHLTGRQCKGRDESKKGRRAQLHSAESVGTLAAQHTFHS